jgi:hypothetical protein
MAMIPNMLDGGLSPIIVVHASCPATGISLPSLLPMVEAAQLRIPCSRIWEIHPGMTVPRLCRSETGALTMDSDLTNCGYLAANRMAIVPPSFADTR